jgi:DNA invertase Pin-like site-specific DNA recombinase
MGDQRVAGYFRVSQARDDMKAPQMYTDEIERYCRYRGLALGEIFADIEYSGYHRSEMRPALNELVARRTELSGVVIPKLSRFGRSLKHLTQLFHPFDADGISLMFLDLGLDTSTSQGRLLRNIMGAFAEYESDVRSDYSKAAIAYRARRGLPPGGWVAYGYRRRGSHYEPTHPESEVVQAMFEFYATGETMTGVARLLNDAGVPSAKGVSGASLR